MATVRELKEFLKQIPDDAEIVIGGEDGYDNLYIEDVDAIDFINANKVPQSVRRLFNRRTPLPTKFVFIR